MAEIGPLGEVESQQAIIIFVRSSLPESVGVGKENLEFGELSSPLKRENSLPLSTVSV